MASSIRHHPDPTDEVRADQAEARPGPLRLLIERSGLQGDRWLGA